MPAMVALLGGSVPIANVMALCSKHLAQRCVEMPATYQQSGHAGSSALLEALCLRSRQHLSTHEALIMISDASMCVSSSVLLSMPDYLAPGLQTCSNHDLAQLVAELFSQPLFWQGADAAHVYKLHALVCKRLGAMHFLDRANTLHEMVIAGAQRAPDPDGIVLPAKQLMRSTRRVINAVSCDVGHLFLAALSARMYGARPLLCAGAWCIGFKALGLFASECAECYCFPDYQ